MDYYVVNAISEERNVSCNVTCHGSENNCSIQLGDGNVNDYNFIVHGMTRVNDSFIYNGDVATDCCKCLSLICLANDSLFFCRSAISREGKNC